MLTLKKTHLIILLSALVIAADRVTKLIASAFLEGEPQSSFLGGLVTFTYAENDGAMLSLGSNLPDQWKFYLFILIVGLALTAGYCYIIYRPIKHVTASFAALILSGGLANLYDRTANDGLVIDFVYLALGSLSTGVFNFADVAIMAGAVGLMLMPSSQPLKGKSLN